MSLPDADNTRPNNVNTDAVVISMKAAVTRRNPTSHPHDRKIEQADDQLTWDEQVYKKNKYSKNQTELYARFEYIL